MRLRAARTRCNGCLLEVWMRRGGVRGRGGALKPRIVTGRQSVVGLCITLQVMLEIVGPHLHDHHPFDDTAHAESAMCNVPE